MQEHELVGRWVGVTGAGSGIGAAISHHAARRGANLAICDIDPARLATAEQALREHGVDVIAGEVDVSEAASVNRFAKAVHDRVDALDILVNNAGVTLAASALETTPEDWEWVLGIDLMGVINGCSAFCPTMRDRDEGGHVVNIASMDGYAAMEGFAAYSTAKFGVVGYSESLRAELARRHIGVSVVCPGPIRTAIVSEMPERGRFAGTYGDRIRAENKKKGVSAERVAKAVFRAVAKNRAIVPVTPVAWMTYYSKRIMPGMTAKALDRVERRFLGE